MQAFVPSSPKALHCDSSVVGIRRAPPFVQATKKGEGGVRSGSGALSGERNGALVAYDASQLRGSQQEPRTSAGGGDHAVHMNDSGEP